MIVKLAEKDFRVGETYNVRLKAPARWVCFTVYDVQGHRVRRYCRAKNPPAVVPAGAVSCRWDGRNGAGEKVALGLYTVVVSADVLSGRAHDSKFNVVLLIGLAAFFLMQGE